MFHLSKVLMVAVCALLAYVPVCLGVLLVLRRDAREAAAACARTVK